MKQLALIPLAALIAGAAGCGLCLATGRNPHLTAMLLAGGAAVVAALLGLVPLMMVRGMGQATAAQAALAGTVLQMILTLGLGGAGWMLQKPGDRAGYIWWLLAFYWVALAALVAIITRAIRQCDVLPSPPTKRQSR